MPQLQCYNIACGKLYDEQDNDENSCQYHSGRPYFHDGYKEWTCCKMRSRDFSTFMNFKGCTKGKHSNVKPVDETPKPQPMTESPTKQTDNGDNNVKEEPAVNLTPPSSDSEVSLDIVESPNVVNQPPPTQQQKTIQMICKNCKVEESKLNMNEPCHYHKGVQIFHDAYKYWSCCQYKKFSDFEDFQKLPPCSKADEHYLIAKIDYRENWFQTGDGKITIALYGLKGVRHSSSNGECKSKVTLRGGKQLKATLINIDGIVVFEKQWNLHDYIDIACSNDGNKVLINVSNVQITLKKLNPRNHWQKLVD